MNIFGFFLFIICSLIGTKRNIDNRKVSNNFIICYFILFIYCCISRVGNTEDYSDLTHYISYFENDNNVYFEPGYILLTDLIKHIFGNSPTVLIVTIAVIITFCIYLTSLILNKLKFNYLPVRRSTLNSGFILIAVYLTYWGLAFGAERLRIGVATSLMILSLLLILNRKKIIPSFLIALAITFQFTISIIVPSLIMIGIIVNKKANCFLSQKIFLIWFLLLIFSRLIFTVIGGGGPIQLFMGNIQNIIVAFDLNHYDSYVYNSAVNSGSIISMKEIFYYICGYVMIHRSSKCIEYNLVVFIYFIGLTLNIFLLGFNAGHRVYDMFLSVNCIAVSLMCILKLLPKKILWQYLIMIIGLQGIMSINYLGLSL